MSSTDEANAPSVDETPDDLTTSSDYESTSESNDDFQTLSDMFLVTIIQAFCFLPIVLYYTVGFWNTRLIWKSRSSRWLFYVMIFCTLNTLLASLQLFVFKFFPTEDEILICNTVGNIFYGLADVTNPLSVSLNVLVAIVRTQAISSITLSRKENRQLNILWWSTIAVTAVCTIINVLSATPWILVGEGETPCNWKDWYVLAHTISILIVDLCNTVGSVIVILKTRALLVGTWRRVRNDVGGSKAGLMSGGRSAKGTANTSVHSAQAHSTSNNASSTSDRAFQARFLHYILLNALVSMIIYKPFIIMEFIQFEWVSFTFYGMMAILRTGSYTLDNVVTCHCIYWMTRVQGKRFKGVLERFIGIEETEMGSAGSADNDYPAMKIQQHGTSNSPALGVQNSSIAHIDLTVNSKILPLKPPHPSETLLTTPPTIQRSPPSMAMTGQTRHSMFHTNLHSSATTADTTFPQHTISRHNTSPRMDSLNKLPSSSQPLTVSSRSKTPTIVPNALGMRNGGGPLLTSASRSDML